MPEIPNKASEKPVCNVNIPKLRKKFTPKFDVI